jgi:glutamate-1-semialdehyde 2,1-aminomutase
MCPPNGDGSFKRSRALYTAASKIIPGNVPRGVAPLLAVDNSPLYFERGAGSRIWDVDGNEYIDYIMAYGAILLGYANACVDKAAIAQVSNGMLLSMNHPLHHLFIDAVLRRFPSADMAYFMKSGSEATSAALRIARHYTRRRKVIRCGFHGWLDWCFPFEQSVPSGLSEQVLPLQHISSQGLQELLSQHTGEVAAVILAPEMVLPLRRHVIKSMIDVTHQHGALFVLDEIKTGFRSPAGSIQQYLNLKPDITTLSKALGNGWPISAVIGRRAIMQSSQDLHLSATYHGETASMAAALANLEIIDRFAVQGHMARLGQLLIDGLNTIADRHHVNAFAYGEPIPAMPFLKFEYPHSGLKTVMRTTFFGEMFKRGILFHPSHLWYISYAHTDADIHETLAVADEAMKITAAKL